MWGERFMPSSRDLRFENDLMISNMAGSKRQIDLDPDNWNQGVQFLVLDTVFPAVLKTQPMKPLSESGFMN